MVTSVDTRGDTGGIGRATTDAGATLGDIARLAACCGTLCGMVEGAMLLWAPELGLQEWFAIRSAVSARVFWFNPVFSTLLFTSIGLLAWLPFRWLARPFHIGLALALNVFVMSFVWLSLLWRINHLPMFIFSLGAAAVAYRWARTHAQELAASVRRGAAVSLALVPLLFAAIEGYSHLQEWRAARALPEALQGAPNVLVVVVDTLRADHLSAYGYSRRTSPNLDRAGAARRPV